jgi:hypothetical protein
VVFGLLAGVVVGGMLGHVEGAVAGAILGAIAGGLPWQPGASRQLDPDGARRLGEIENKLITSTGAWKME